MIHFHSPWWCLLIIPIIGALLLNLLKKRPTFRIPASRIFAEAGHSRGPGMTGLPSAFYFIGFSCLTLALMRPQFGQERTIRNAEGIDIILALDASGSMEAYDAPAEITTKQQLYSAIDSKRLKNRIEVAKEALETFVKKRPDDRMGLIAFATLPFVASPPTLDHDFLLGHLQNLEAGTLGDHTGIPAPIASGTNRLQKSVAKRRVLVLFTDGENNVDDRITPEQAAKLAKTFDVIIYTVGIGSNRAYRLVQGFGGMRLQEQGSNYNRGLLENISEMTGGRYFEAGDAKSFDTVMQEIDALETSRLEQPVVVDYQERFILLLIPGLICLVVACLLQNTVFLVAP